MEMETRDRKRRKVEGSKSDEDDSDDLLDQEDDLESDPEED